MTENFSIDTAQMPECSQKGLLRSDIFVQFLETAENGNVESFGFALSLMRWRVFQIPPNQCSTALCHV